MSMVLVVFVFAIVYFLLDWLLRSLHISDYGRRYILISGCDSGFGKILALKLDKMGFHVFAGCLTKNGESVLKSEASDRIRPFHLDVCSPESIQECLNFVKKGLPSEKALWAVVNNAGIGGELGPPYLSTKQGFQKTLDVNLYGPMEICRLFLPLLRHSKGRIVNMTSMCGRIPAADGPYCASKYGLEGYTDSLRREVYWQGIKVSMLEPEYFRTDILRIDNMMKNLKDRLQSSSEDVKAALGEGFFEKYDHRTKVVIDRADLNLNPVIDAYLHAITSRFPRTRYVVGIKAKLFFIPLSYIPDCILNVIMAFLRNSVDSQKP